MSEPDTTGRAQRPPTTGHRFAARRRAVDRPPRSAGIARALARPAPGVATAVLCLLALLAGTGHTLLVGHVRAAVRRAPHAHTRRHAHATHRHHHRHRRATHRGGTAR